MKSFDKLMLGIVLGIVALVALAVALVWLRPKPGYEAEDTAAGVAHNYLYALTQKDYARAYSYLSPSLLRYPPTLAAFTADIEATPWEFSLDPAATSITVAESQVQPSGITEVTMRQRHFFQSQLFERNDYADTFLMDLQQEAGQWKLTGANRYWKMCWSVEEATCP